MNPSTDERDLHPQTKEFIRNSDLEERKDMGQYFTSQTIINDLLKELPESVTEESELRILDPASGTGEFILNALDRFDSPQIEGWELDEELADISRDVLPDSVTITETNTLFTDSDKQYDLIIGNPPYYEITLTDKLRDQYSEVIYGRTNIYSLFIYKSLTMLADDGYLAFVNPPSMNNGAYFKELRKYIVENCSIEHLSIHEDAELFEGASQSIMYFIVKKGNSHNDYVFSKNDITIFSEDAEYLKNKFKDRKTLSELGYQVTTGKLVWNQHKDLLREDVGTNTIPIVWSKNIKNESLEIGSDVHSKPQYIEDFESNEGPAVVVNRVVGKPGSGSIKAAYIPSGKSFVGENHVNVIQPRDDVEQEIDLHEVLRQLNAEENVELVQKITGNSQISKTELQELFPLKVE